MSSLSESRTFNRTKLELKRTAGDTDVDTYASFNRTKLELKPA